MKENNYRPLPDSLHIGTSIIEGNGLFRFPLKLHKNTIRWVRKPQ